MAGAATEVATDETSAEADAHVNEVRLRGRVAAVPEERELPSGDRIVTARLVVARPPGPARQRQPVDVLDCVAWTGAGPACWSAGGSRARWSRSRARSGAGSAAVPAV